MANKKEKDRVAEVHGWIRDDLKWREYWGGEKKWVMYEDNYRGEFTGENIHPYNLYFPILRGTIPEIYFRNPRVTLSISDNLGTSVKSKIAERVVNRLITTTHLKPQMRSAAQDTWFCGTGFLVHGYDSEFGFLQGTEGLNMDKNGNLLEYHKNVIPGMPWTLRAHPVDILLPWGATDTHSLRRFSMRILRPLEDVKNDERYTKSVREKLGPSSVRIMREEGKRGAETQEEWIYLYETQDFRTGKRTVVSDPEGKTDRFLLEEDALLLNILGEVPLTPIVWNHNSRSIWGVSDARILEEDQLEVTTVNTLAAKERRINLPKFFYDLSVMDPAEVEKFESDRVGSGVGIDGSPRDVIMEIQQRGAPGQMLEMQRLIQGAREKVGFSETRGGAYTYPTKRTTAAEVRDVGSGMDIRNSEKRDAIAEAIKDCGQKWLKMIYHLWNEPRVIYAPGIDINYDWIVFRGTDLRANYELQVNPEEMRPPTRQDRQSEAVSLAPELLKLAGTVPGMNPIEVIREVLSRFPGWDMGKIFPGQQPQLPPKGVAQLHPSGVLLPLVPGQGGEEGG